MCIRIYTGSIVSMGSQIKHDLHPNIRTIALTLTSLAAGGAEKQCILLASLLKPYYTILLIIIDAQPRHHQHLRLINQHNLDTVYLEGSYLNKVLQLRRIVRQRKINLVFSYLPKDILMTSLAIGGMNLYHIGGIRNARMSRTKRNILKYIHNLRLKGSISNCHSGKEFFSTKGFDANKITVIPNGIKVDRGPTEHVSTKKIIISSLGRLVDQKDYPTALRSIAYLKPKLHGTGLEIHYNIVGDGTEKSSLLKLVQQSGLTKEVSLITDIKDIPKLLQNTDIYLSTSVFEGVSNAMMEAMSLSLPIVATDAGDNKYLVKDKINGYVTRQKDEIGIGNALYDLIVSPERRLSMGIASYQLIREHFNLDLFLNHYMRYIASLTNDKP